MLYLQVPPCIAHHAYVRLQLLTRILTIFFTVLLCGSAIQIGIRILQCIKCYPNHFHGPRVLEKMVMLGICHLLI